jgi:hypothetical protein
MAAVFGWSRGKTRSPTMRNSLMVAAVLAVLAGAAQAQPYGPEGREGFGPPGRGREARGFEGVRTVFFPRPTVRGLDLAAGRHGADVFCRRQGLGPAVWFDEGERAPRAIGPEGQMTGPSPVIRDLLCRKY